MSVFLRQITNFYNNYNEKINKILWKWREFRNKRLFDTQQVLTFGARIGNNYVLQTIGQSIYSISIQYNEHFEYPSLTHRNAYYPDTIQRTLRKSVLNTSQRILSTANLHLLSSCRQLLIPSSRSLACLPIVAEFRTVAVQSCHRLTDQAVVELVVRLVKEGQ